MALKSLEDRLLKMRMAKGKGNPYSVVATKGGFGVKNTKKGTFRSKGIPKDRAMKQFNLLEGLEHGWKPRGRK